MLEKENTGGEWVNSVLRPRLEHSRLQVIWETVFTGQKTQTNSIKVLKEKAAKEKENNENN